ncbi:MAG: SAM-dependent chlorinase/fluorinase [Candidatus Competibacteraceae bacterium]|nr:SAM-dependent chlorinase/fluorinase [Candidatus Competibacteraceae bacterium]
MLALFTDFGLQGPYVGQLKLVLQQRAPAVPVIDLFHDVPVFDSQGAAYLLAAYVTEFPVGTVFIGVIDPGVGSNRPGLILHADGRCFVGPDNGLFDRVAARANQAQTWHITWRPERLSASFHGRDWFAPVAAMLACGVATPERLGTPIVVPPLGWPDDLARIVYIDRFGNAMTGIRAQVVDKQATVLVEGEYLPWARTFSDVPVGQGFWYENANGLLELAVNQGNAAQRFKLCPGTRLQVLGNVSSVIRDS